MKPKVAILLPTMGKMEAVLHDWLVLTAGSGKYSLLDLKTYGISPVDKAFNILHRRFLDSDADYAFVLNDDECPEPGALDRLMAHDKDIVSGVCWKWTEEQGPLPVAARWSEEAQTFYWVQGEGLEKIDRVSFSGVLMKRAVLEKVLVGTYAHLPICACECGWADHRARKRMMDCPKCGKKLIADGTEMASPGFLFMDEARRRGFEVWMDFGVRIHHYKTVDLQRVNDLMALARNETKAEVLAAVKDLAAKGVPDAEIIGALVG
ncbi:MAG: hypothetical protein LLG08_04070 [Actinomycetia bacterium]|nr:hypothetical protein [Actinomycetes bacterium]